MTSRKMMIINKSSDDYLWEEVKCYKCNTIFNVHPMTNMNSERITNCNIHNPLLQNISIVKDKKLEELKEIE
jgi:hypothetical protein